MVGKSDKRFRQLKQVVGYGGLQLNLNHFETKCRQIQRNYFKVSDEENMNKQFSSLPWTSKEVTCNSPITLVAK